MALTAIAEGLNWTLCSQKWLSPYVSYACLISSHLSYKHEINLSIEDIPSLAYTANSLTQALFLIPDIQERMISSREVHAARSMDMAYGDSIIYKLRKVRVVMVEKRAGAYNTTFSMAQSMSWLLIQNNMDHCSQFH